MTKVFEITPESNLKIWAMLQLPVIEDAPADLVPHQKHPDNLRAGGATDARGIEVIDQVNSLRG